MIDTCAIFWSLGGQSILKQILFHVVFNFNYNHRSATLCATQVDKLIATDILINALVGPFKTQPFSTPLLRPTCLNVINSFRYNPMIGTCVLFLGMKTIISIFEKFSVYGPVHSPVKG